MGKIKAMIMIGRPWFYGFGVIGVLFSSLLTGSVPPIIPLVLGLLVFGPLIPGGCTALNDCYDMEIDKMTKPESPITSGQLTRSFALKFSYICYILGLGISLMINWIFFLCALGFAILSYIYSVPPLRIKGRHVFGTAAKGLGYGMFVLIAGVSLTTPDPFTFEIILLGLLMSLAVFGLSITTEFRDIDADRKHGIVTITSLFSRKTAARITSGLVLLPYVLFLLLSGFGVLPGTFLPVGFLIFFALIISVLLLRDPSPEGSMKPAGLAGLLVYITFIVMGLSGFLLG